MGAHAPSGCIRGLSTQCNTGRAHASGARGAKGQGHPTQMRSCCARFPCSRERAVSAAGHADVLWGGARASSRATGPRQNAPVLARARARRTPNAPSACSLPCVLAFALLPCGARDQSAQATLRGLRRAERANEASGAALVRAMDGGATGVGGARVPCTNAWARFRSGCDARKWPSKSRARASRGLRGGARKDERARALEAFLQRSLLWL